MGPPGNVVGTLVPLGIFAGRTSDAAVFLASATAYPTGAELAVDIRWRPEHDGVFQQSFRWYSEPRQGGGLPDELLRLGVQYPDGSKATTLGMAMGLPAARRPGEVPEKPVFLLHGGGGMAHGWSQTIWLWPLPPQEHFDFVCEWPVLGIDLTRVRLDSGSIREAARRSVELWEDAPEPPIIVGR
jgi:hypothetical protein